jgi:hypothetical protein
MTGNPAVEQHGPGLGSDDLLLDGCQQQLGFGQGQAEFADTPRSSGRAISITSTH